jgi:hypothetical protein
MPMTLEWRSIAMTRTLSTGRRRLIVKLGAVAGAAFLSGCASTTPPPPDEAQLLAAGFKVVVAKTVQQKEHLQTLPPGKITEWQRTGVHFFVYPDVAKSQILVGTATEYAAYRRLQPNGGASLGQQQAGDMASYDKQDAAMQKYTARDLADPYYFWDSFDGLGWR